MSTSKPGSGSFGFLKGEDKQFDASMKSIDGIDDKLDDIFKTFAVTNNPILEPIDQMSKEVFETKESNGPKYVKENIKRKQNGDYNDDQIVYGDPIQARNGQYGQPAYQQPTRGHQGQYGQPVYQQPMQYHQGQYGQYGQPAYQQPMQYHQGQYGQPAYQQPMQYHQGQAGYQRNVYEQNPYYKQDGNNSYFGAWGGVIPDKK